MVNLPLFPYYYANLHSSFIVLDSFLQFLRKEEFNGFLEFILPDKKNYIFIEMGNFYKGVSINKEIIPCTLKDIQKDFILNACKLPEDELIYWSNFYHSSILYENLSTDFTDSVKLINKLKSEGLNGFLNIKHKKGSLTIYFFNGNLFGFSTSDNGRFVRDSGKLSALVKEIDEAIFNVYKINFEQNIEVSPDKEKLKDILNEFFNYMSSFDKKFTLTLRKICLSGANRYPFIDPFSGEFEFTEKGMYIDEEIRYSELLDGVRFILNSIMKTYKFSEEQKTKLKNIIEEKGFVYSDLVS